MPTMSRSTRRHAIPFGSLALALAFLGGCATQQGVISGRVRLAPVPRVTSAVPQGVARDPRGTVIYLESIPDTTLARLRLTPGPDAAVIEAGPHGLVPMVTAVPVGGTLIVRNRDRVFHRLFARAGADSFDTGNIRPGESGSVHFTTTGRFLVFCVIHPDELAMVVVTPNRVLAQAGRDGAFHLPPLPLGHYELHAWHPAYGEIRRDVDLRDPRGARVTLDF